MKSFKSAWIPFTLLLFSSFAFGLWLNRNGLIAWDDWEHLRQSRWLLSQYGLIDVIDEPSETMKWYGPLWELTMGLFSFIFFGWLKDPHAVRHALTFALFPLTLWGVYRFARRAGASLGGALLAAATLFACIRFGGHAAINIKDFPFACGFLLVTLYQWDWLRRALSGPTSTSADPRESGRTAATALEFGKLGALSVVPYLLRPPVALHFAVALCLGLYVVYFAPLAKGARPAPEKLRRLKAYVALPCAAVAMVILTYPILWTEGVDGWIQSFALFGKFPWVGPVRLYGVPYLSNALPWWYSFAWIPLMLHPFALLTVLAGLGGLFSASARKAATAIPLAVGSLKIRLSQPLWLLLITGLAWAAVLAKSPVLYDEERHLLFLYPPLFVATALGLATLEEKAKLLLAGVLTCAALVSYASWNRYAYVYKNPLLGSTSPQRFTGDYWGLCVNPTMLALKGKVPPTTPIAIFGPSGIGPQQLDRLRESRLAADPAYSGHKIVEIQDAKNPVVLIGVNRMDMLPVIGQFLQKGGQLVHEERMPPGEPSCIAVYMR